MTTPREEFELTTKRWGGLWMWTPTRMERAKGHVWPAYVTEPYHYAELERQVKEAMQAATAAAEEACVTRAAAALESTGLNPPQRHYVLAAIRDKETE